MNLAGRTLGSPDAMQRDTSIGTGGWELVMGKGRQRGNREVRKPKKVKKAEPAPTLVGLDISRALPGPKKKR